MYHDIGVQIESPAAIDITAGVLTITPGNWPDWAGMVSLPHVAEPLGDTDAFVYLDRQGGIVLSNCYLEYGLGAAGQENELLDLLAWKDAGEWHIKRLVSEAPHA